MLLSPLNRSRTITLITRRCSRYLFHPSFASLSSGKGPHLDTNCLGRPLESMMRALSTASEAPLAVRGQLISSSRSPRRTSRTISSRCDPQAVTKTLLRTSDLTWVMTRSLAKETTIFLLWRMIRMHPQVTRLRLGLRMLAVEVVCKRLKVDLGSHQTS